MLWSCWKRSRGRQLAGPSHWRTQTAESVTCQVRSAVRLRLRSRSPICRAVNWQAGPCSRRRRRQPLRRDRPIAPSQRDTGAGSRCSPLYGVSLLLLGLILHSSLLELSPTLPYFISVIVVTWSLLSTTTTEYWRHSYIELRNNADRREPPR